MRRRFISYQGLQESFDYNHYLTIEALEDGLTVVFDKEIEYGIDGVGWKKLRGGLKSPSINKGHTISFRAKLTPTIWNSIGTFTISNACNLIGNVMSLLFYNDAASATSLIGFDYAFRRLFKNCTTIKSVSSNFTPATTLANSCYEDMFQGCTSLVNAPELPATTLSLYCYSKMFYKCTNLNYIKMLATNILANGCLDYWVYGVSSTGTFVKSKDATWDVRGVSGIPEGWTVKTDDEESGGNSLFPAMLIPSIDENIPNYTIAKYFIDTYPDMVVDISGKYSPIAEDVTIEGSNYCDGKVIGVAKWVDGSSLLFYTENSIANIRALKVFLGIENLGKGISNEYLFD